MDKKDIYEHLAKIYLDASSKKNKKTKTFPSAFKKVIVIIVFFLFSLSAVLFIKQQRKNPFNPETALVLLHDTARINFNFDPAKKETYTFNLNKLNVGRFNSLKFLAKRADYNSNISLRVEFTNVFNEKSEVYFKDIPHKWYAYKVNLAQFKNISDWTEMSNLTFIIEEWNAREKKGLVYLDNVRLVK